MFQESQCEDAFKKSNSTSIWFLFDSFKKNKWLGISEARPELFMNVTLAIIVKVSTPPK